MRRSVSDDVVGARGARARRPRSPSLRLVDLVARAAQHHRERGAHVALIVDDENLRHTVPRLLRGNQAAVEEPRGRALATTLLRPRRSALGRLPVAELLGEVGRLAELLR